MTPFPWHREPLARLLADRERLPHAMLVHGPAGIGKVEFARALGAAVLCESPRERLACGECPSCHWFSQGNHPDYREVLPEAAAEDEPLARAYLINALACLGDAEGRKLLGQNLASDNAAVRTYSADFAGHARTAEHRDQLVRLLDDSTLDVRVRAAQSILMLAK